MRAIDVKLSLTSIQSNTLGLKVALPAKPNSRSSLSMQTRQTVVFLVFANKTNRRCLSLKLLSLGPAFSTSLDSCCAFDAASRRVREDIYLLLRILILLTLGFALLYCDSRKQHQLFALSTANHQLQVSLSTLHNLHIMALQPPSEPIENLKDPGAHELPGVPQITGNSAMFFSHSQQLTHP